MSSPPDRSAEYTFASPPSLREVDHDVTAFIRLAEYTRKNGYRLGPVVKVGSLQFQVEDLRVDDHEGLKPDQHQARRGIWEEAGLDDGLPSDGTVGR